MRALLDDPDQIATSEIVIMELLAGTRSPVEARELRSRLLSFDLLRLEGLEDFEHAAVIWRTCRSHGERLRSLADCLVSAVAIRSDASILHQDADYDIIARHTALELDSV